jgi:hypothetical protein
MVADADHENFDSFSALACAFADIGRRITANTHINKMLFLFISGAKIQQKMQIRKRASIFLQNG